MYNCNLPCAVLFAGPFVLTNASATRHTHRPVSHGLTRRVVALTVACPTGQRHYWFVLELPADELASGASRVAMTYLVLQNVLEAWARDYYIT